MSSGSVTLPATGGSGGGIASINGDTTAAQLIVGGTGITVGTVAGTTTISATGGGSGTVTSVDVSGGTTGLTTSGGPITTSGTITLAGTLAISNGGTGQTTANPAFNALSPLTTKGDLLGFSTVNARLPIGTNTQVLTADSTQTLGVKWATPTSGTVTSVDVSGGTTGLSFSGGPITSSGTITMAGTLAVANGGTNSTAALNNNRVMQSSGGAIVEAAAITASRALASDANGIPVASVTTAAELAFVNGVTSSIQTQLNGKQASGNYITALTGDVTASGPGSVAATIAVGAVTDTKASLANKPAVTVVATTNQALTGTPTIDGQATAAGSIILLTAQSTGSQNGPWVAAAGAWSRPTWYPSGGTTQAFQFITTLVRLGTTYQGTTWRQTAAGPITIDTTATTWVVTPYALNSSTITGTLPVANTNSNLLVSTAGIVIDGGGSVVTTGSKGFIQVNFNATVTSWTVLADQSGSIVVDVKRSTYASFPTTASIVGGGNAPTLSSVQKNTATPSGWTSTTITAGDVLEFSVTSASTVTRVTVQLLLTRT